MYRECQFIPTERVHRGSHVALKRGTYLDKGKESALVLGGELLRIALGRHDSGILSLAVISGSYSSNGNNEREIYRYEELGRKQRPLR